MTFIFLVAGIGWLSALDPLALNEHIVDELRDLPYSNEEAICIPKYFETILSHIARDLNMGPSDMRMSVMTSFAEFASFIIQNEISRQSIMSICDVLGAAVGHIGNFGATGERFLHVFVSETAHAILLRTGIDMLAIPGFMEPEWQAAYRQLSQDVVWVGRFSFRNLIARSLTLVETQYLVRILSALCSEAIAYQKSNPSFLFNYRPLMILLRHIEETQTESNISLLTLSKQLYENRELHPLEIEFQVHHNSPYPSSSYIPSLLFNARLGHPDRYRKLCHIVERYIEIAKTGRMSPELHQQFESASFLVVDFDAQVEPLLQFSEGIQTAPTIEQSHSDLASRFGAVIPGDSFEAIRIRNNLLLYFSRIDMTGKEQLIESCLRIVAKAYQTYISNSSRLRTLVFWSKEVGDLQGDTVKHTPWIRLAYSFSVLFRDLLVRLDLSCFPEIHQDRFNLFFSLIERGSFPVSHTIPGVQYIRIKGYLSFVLNNGDNEVDSMVKVFEAFHLNKLKWYQYGKTARCPLDNLFVKFRDHPEEYDRIVAKMNKFGVHLESHYHALELGSQRLPRDMYKYLASFVMNDIANEYLKVEIFETRMLASIKERLSVVDLLVDENMFLDLLYEIALMKSFVTELDTLNMMEETVKTFLLSKPASTLNEMSTNLEMIVKGLQSATSLEPTLVTDFFTLFTR